MTTSVLYNNETTVTTVSVTTAVPVVVPMPSTPVDASPMTLKGRVSQVLKFILYPLILINNLFKSLVLSLLSPFIFGEKKIITAVNPTLRQNLIALGGQELQLQASKSRTLEALYFTNPSTQDLIGRGKTVLLFTGSHQSYESFAPPLVKFYLSQGYNILCVNSAGFGKSQGRPSQKGLEEAADLSYNYVHNVKNFSDDKILVHGYSLGTYPAAYLASKYPLNKIVLDRGFSKVSNVARDEGTLLFGSKCAGFAAKHMTKYAVPLNVEAKLAKAKSDVVILQGIREQAAPYHKEALIAAFAKGQNKTPAELFQSGKLRTIDLPIEHIVSPAEDLLPLFQPVVQALAARTGG